MNFYSRCVQFTDTYTPSRMQASRKALNMKNMIQAQVI